MPNGASEPSEIAKNEEFAESYHMSCGNIMK